jgi:5-hydroxyisourate hydrolase-like protein (transthyretin family)
MDHDVRTLQTFIETKLDAMETARITMHMENKNTLEKLTDLVTATNGRVRKAEVAIAVLKFAVYTIGGSILLTGLQVIVPRLVAHQ